VGPRDRCVSLCARACARLPGLIRRPAWPRPGSSS
jgi:hypothetical protein